MIPIPGALILRAMSYYMSIQADANLRNIGLAAPSATVFGILLNVLYFVFYNKK